MSLSLTASPTVGAACGITFGWQSAARKHSGITGIKENKMETAIMENQMEKWNMKWTLGNIWVSGFRVWGLGFRLEAV